MGTKKCLGTGRAIRLPCDADLAKDLENFCKKSGMPVRLAVCLSIVEWIKKHKPKEHLCPTKDHSPDCESL